MNPQIASERLTSTVTSPADTELPLAISGHRQPRDPVRAAHLRDDKRGSPPVDSRESRNSPISGRAASSAIRPRLPLGSELRFGMNARAASTGAPDDACQVACYAGPASAPALSCRVANQQTDGQQK